MEYPNVLILMADDHRFDAIAAHGDPTVKTPNIDRLVREGMSFTQNWHTGSYSPAVCMPTRAALHTGTCVYEATRFDDQQGRKSTDSRTIDPDRVTLGQALRKAGYHTYMIGKWHNDHASCNRSFCDGDELFFGGMSDHYAVPAYDYHPECQYDINNVHIKEKHSTELFTDAALDFLNSYNEAKPFYLNIAFTSPHDPRQAPQVYHDMYPADEMPLPVNFQQHPFDQGHSQIRDEALASFPRNEAQIKQHISDYYAMISHHDHHIGLILDALEKRGELENTIVVYTADHGLAVGQHGLMGKQNMYEHSVRVPLIIRGPGVPAGICTNQLTQTPDLYPTLMSLLGIELSDTVTACDMTPVMAGHQLMRSHLFCLYLHMQRSVRDNRYKLIRYYKQEQADSQFEGTNMVQLFDLQNDPWEINNLYGKAGYEQITQSLVKALQMHLNRYDDMLKNLPILM